MSSASASQTEIEEGLALRPKFDAAGLITCVTTDVETGDVLMVAYMNAEALHRTIETGEAWYFSRSRNKLWKKGEISGHVQQVAEIRMDCDQDAIWLKVHQTGEGACHTGRHSCFYRIVTRDRYGGPSLSFIDAEKAFDPDEVYKK